MPVIAMNQEMGSQGKFVAEKLAEELGLDIVRHEIIDQLIKKVNETRLIKFVLFCFQPRISFVLS